MIHAQIEEAEEEQEEHSYVHGWFGKTMAYIYGKEEFYPFEG